MPLIVLKLKSGRRRLILATLAAMLMAASVFAQSIEPNAPTPVVSNEIAGRIAPLDIGDARQTRFFYAFNGLQGDLELTVESSNLDGDIDIFLASNLRPLAKVTLYAGASSSKVAKTVYVRREEPLILRVQARTPNDAEGTYRVTFGGAFRPAERLAVSNSDAASSVEPTPANPPPTPLSARSPNRKIRRVTSTGARIEEPLAEVVVKEETEKSEESPKPPPVAAKKTTARPVRNRAGTRGNARTPTARRSPAGTESGEAEKGEASKPEESKGETGERSESAAKEKPAKPERPRPVRVPRSRNNRNSSTARRNDAPPAESVPTSPAETPAPPAPSPRLVLVMRDGETFERDMSSVRRVTVENGMIVIVSKNGKTERQPMASVLRMSIEP